MNCGNQQPDHKESTEQHQHERKQPPARTGMCGLSALYDVTLITCFGNRQHIRTSRNSPVSGCPNRRLQFFQIRTKRTTAISKQPGSGF